MKISAKGLALFGILIIATGVVPAFADANSTNSTNSTAASAGPAVTNSSSATNSSAAPAPAAAGAGRGTASSQTGSYVGTNNPATNARDLLANQSTANLTPPPYLVTNATGNPGQIISMGTSAPAVTVTTDKASYNGGDKVVISGSTKDYLGDTPLTLILRNPDGNVVSVNQVQVNPDKTYSISLTAGGALWQAAGTYSVYVQFGGPDRSATTKFQFSGSHVAGNTMMVDGTNSSVTYTITNGKVTDIKADTISKSLIVTIETTGDGNLTITMPRALIDAKKSDGTDDQYFVLNDGQENDQFAEIANTPTERTLQIPFTDGTSQIEIIGTFVVPEFGAMAAVVLVVAIIAIIAISSKNGLRIQPKA